MTRNQFALILLALILCLASAGGPVWADGGLLGAIEAAPIAEAESSAAAPAAASSPSAPPSTMPAPVSSPAAASSPTAQQPSASATPQGMEEILHPSQWQFPHNFSIKNPDTWPFIPVPEIATDPNGGTTVGILAAVLFNDQNHQITDIFAPDVETNTTLGPGGTFRYLSYPSEDTQWYAIAGAQEKIARKVDVDYQTGRTHRKWWSFEGRFYFEKDPTDRFFGVGNDSRLGNETNFTTEQLYALGVFGVNFSEDLQLAFTFRPKRVRIHDGAFSNLPGIFKIFPHQKGLNGGTEVLNQLVLAYDTRDSIEIPRKGGLALIYADLADRRFMSSSSYTRFGAEVRRYYKLAKNVTFAGHMFMQYMPAGDEPPFWALARLGGEDSLLIDQQTLRGYGAGRYVDDNLAVANAEVRTRVYDRDLFGTHGIFELAPFLDIGRVGHTMGYNPLSDLHTVGGVGFRGIAEPFVVGYVDVGYGGEGVAVFSGINYPF